MDVSQTRRWVLKEIISNRGKISIHNAPKSSHSITVSIDEHHAHVDDIIWENRRIKQFEIASMKERVQAIIANLNYQKPCVKTADRIQRNNGLV